MSASLTVGCVDPWRRACWTGASEGAAAWAAVAAGAVSNARKMSFFSRISSSCGRAGRKFVAGPLNIVVQRLSSLFLSLKIQTQVQTQAQNLLASPQAMPTMKGGTI